VVEADLLTWLAHGSNADRPIEEETWENLMQSLYQLYEFPKDLLKYRSLIGRAKEKRICSNSEFGLQPFAEIPGP
jgi:hypothetical protein